ncbi:MAG: twin-arginine translocase TatA/TatE family subunit [Anaerolineales bacterium]|jgi:sec-independent protein translocase protein TatA|nr:MAG: twin-arginine translocase TatA/TatE family subunit [Anaerolineales bacterium]
MPNLGPTELIIILIIVILIFGAGKLPEIGGALGKGIKEFKFASKELEEATDEVKSITSLKEDEESDQG